MVLEYLVSLVEEVIKNGEDIDFLYEELLRWKKVF